MSERVRRLLPDLACLLLYASGIYGVLLWPPVRGSVIAFAEPLRSALRPSVDHLPLLARWIAAFVAYDALAYAIHRAAHASPLLWRLHRFHHSGSTLGPLTTFRFHIAEIAWRMALQFLPLYVLGVAAAVPDVVWVALLAFNVLAHSGLDWTFGPLGRFIVSPAHHRMHHDGHDANYGMFLVVWDAAFAQARSMRHAKQP